MSGAALPLVQLSIGGAHYKAFKDELAERLCDQMPHMLTQLEDYAEVSWRCCLAPTDGGVQEAWALEDTLRTKMTALPSAK